MIKLEQTSCMTSPSGVKVLGNSHGIAIAIVPSVNPTKAPIIRSDFSSLRACLIGKRKAVRRFPQRIHNAYVQHSSMSFKKKEN